VQSLLPYRMFWSIMCNLARKYWPNGWPSEKSYKM